MLLSAPELQHAVMQHVLAGIAGLQAAVDAPGRVAGVQLMDVSLRMLHTQKQAAWQRPLVTAIQRVLRETPLGAWFFNTIAKPDVRQCLLRPSHAFCCNFVWRTEQG